MIVISPSPHHKYLAIVLVVVLASAILIKTHHSLAAPAASPEPTTLDATVTDLRTLQTTKSRTQATLVPNALEKPSLLFLGFTPTNKPNTFEDKLFPGGMAIFRVSYTAKDLPITNLRVVLKYPDFVSLGQIANFKGMAGGEHFPEQHRIVWAIDHVPAGNFVAADLTFLIPEELALEYRTFNLTAFARSAERPNQASQALALDLWGEVVGRLAVKDRQGGEQPLSGLSLRLFADNKALDPVVATDSEGRYTLAYRRADLPTEDLAGKTRLLITFQTPDRSYGLPLAFKFFRTEKDADKYDPETHRKDLKLQLKMAPATAEALRYRRVEWPWLFGAKPVIDESRDIAEPSEFVDILQLDTAAVMWKNLWQASEYLARQFTSSVASADEPLTVYLHPGSATKTSLDKTTKKSVLIFGKEDWYARDGSPQNREFHELAHAVLINLGVLNQGKPVTAQTVLPLAKIPEIPLDENHGGWLNDSSADSFHEGFAAFFAIWLDRRVNGIYDPRCQWCYFASDGSAIQGDYPSPIMAGLLPAGFDQQLDRLRIIWPAYDTEEVAVKSFLRHLFIGGSREIGELESQQFGWTRQEAAADNFALIPYLETTDAEAEKRLAVFFSWLHDVHPPRLTLYELIAWARGTPAITPVDTLKHPSDVSRPSVLTLAVLHGIFLDQDADSRFDRHREQIGIPGQNQGFWIKRTTGRDVLIGPRPWREQIEIDPAQSIDVAFVHRPQNLSDGVPMTLKIDFAPPFEKFSYQTTVTTAGGKLPLVLPPPIYRTRTSVHIDGSETTVLAIDSNDYWQTLQQSFPPASVAKLTVDFEKPNEIAVPALPSAVTQAAALPSLEFLEIVEAQSASGSKTPLVPPRAAPGNAPPVVRSIRVEADEVAPDPSSSPSTSPSVSVTNMAPVSSTTSQPSPSTSAGETPLSPPLPLERLANATNRKEAEAAYRDRLAEISQGLKVRLAQLAGERTVQLAEAGDDRLLRRALDRHSKKETAAVKRQARRDTTAAKRLLNQKLKELKKAARRTP